MTKGISIIIPVLNEAAQLPQLISQLNQFSSIPHEVLFVDGGSSDDSVSVLKHLQQKVVHSTMGRAHQMNTGAAKARFPWLYFLHADSHLPANASQLLWEATTDQQQAACFQLAFSFSHWLLRLSAKATKANHLLCRGGDQSLLIHNDFFKQLGGFDPQYKVCEDIALIRKIYQKGRFEVLNATLVTSARRFTENGVLQLLFHFGVLHLLHYWGAAPQQLHRYYCKFVK